MTRHAADSWPADVRDQQLTQPGISQERRLRVAVLDRPGPNRDYVCDVIHKMGYVVQEFECTDNLVSSLMVGMRFNIAVASFNGDQNAALSGARNLQHAAGALMPVLLMMKPDQFLHSDVFVPDPAINFFVLPCEEWEMVARVAASMKAAKSLNSPQQLSFGRYRFEPYSWSVALDSCRIQLKPREFELALYLFRNAGTAVSRESIFAAVWPRGCKPIETRTIDVHIANVRRKLMLTSEHAARLTSVYGLGYLLLLEA